MTPVYPGLAGRRALVTGAAGGIGRAIVRRLSVHGSLVCALDRDAVSLERVAAENAGDAPVHTIAVDVRDPSSTTAVVDEVELAHGPIDLVVLAAGVFEMASVDQMTDEAWNELFAVNATGVFNVARAVSRRMMPRRRGAIVTVSSNAAGVPRQQMAGYAASKAAATMFTRCLGLELAPHRIRCNVVAPGSTRTPMQEAMWARGSSEAAVIAGNPEAFRLGIPLARIAEPDDVVEPTLFLLSDAARHVTMAEWYVDGGASLRG